MASLQDLLASKQPTELEALLASLKGQQSPPAQNSSSAYDMPQASPGPAPTPGMPGPAIPPTPLSPQMLGMKMGSDPNSSSIAQNPEESRNTAQDRAPASDDSSDDSDSSKDSDKDSDDDSDEDESPSKPSSGPVKVSDDHYNGDATDDQKKNLQDLFNNVHSLSTLRGAQDKENDNRLISGLGQAFTTLNNGAIGLSTKSAPPKDISSEFYKEQMKNADAPVRNIKDQQAKDLEDPNSNASQSARQLAGSVLQKAGFSPSMIDGMSHDDILKQFPQFAGLLTHKDATDANRLKAQELHEYQMARVGAMADQNQNKIDTKATDNQNKANTGLHKDINTYRGNQAAQQAATGVLNAKRALDVLNQYPDPNKMPPEMVKMFTSEIAKIATGGSPTEATMHEIQPGGGGMTAAQMVSKITNAPTPALQGAYIKQYSKYLNNIMNTSNDALSAYKADIAKGYFDRVSPEQKEEFLSDHPDIAGYISTHGKNAGTPAPGGKSTVMQNGHTYNWNPQTGKYE